MLAVHSAGNGRTKPCRGDGDKPAAGYRRRWGYTTFLKLFFDGYALNKDRFDGAVAAIGFNLPDCVNDVSRFLVSNRSKYRVLTQQPLRGRHGDEKLGAVSSPAHANTRVRHGQHIGLVEVQFWVNFIVKHVARPAGSRSFRAAGLQHETANNAVEGQTVVKRFRLFLAGCLIRPFLSSLSQTREVPHCFGSLIGVELDSNIAF